MPPEETNHWFNLLTAGNAALWDATVGPAGAAWRRRTVDVLLIAVVLGHTPLLIGFLLGHSTPVTPVCAASFLLAYVIMTTAALLRFTSVALGVRVWMYFAAAYLVVIPASIGSPRNGYAQAGPIAIPVVLMVIGGPRIARYAALASAATLLGAPLLRQLPIVQSLLVHPSVAGGPPIRWVQNATLVVMLAIQIVLLDRFCQFLLLMLANQRRAAANLAAEADERRRLERAVAEIADRERQRLSHDIHDSICQHLAGALLQCEALENRIGRGERLAVRDLATIKSLINDSVDEAHNVAFGLHPLDSDPDALAPALHDLTAMVSTAAPPVCEFRAVGDVGTPDPETAQHLYRIAQEAISNAARHANATRIVVELRDCGDDLRLTIEDDGIGLPAQPSPGGMGLRTMANRARLLGGELRLQSTDGGLRVECQVSRDGAAWPEDPHAG